MLSAIREVRRRSNTDAPPLQICGLLALGLVLVVVLGVLVCIQPFTGDQARFAAGARQLARGDVLYRDVWDVKQPGICAFYLAGGGLLGDTEVALQLFELATLLGFAVVLATTLRERFE